VSEHPVQKSGVDGTGLTEAVCPDHKGKPRTVSADGLKVAGASDAVALRCLVPDKDKALCQQFLVPLESHDEHGRTIRKGGKLLDKPEEPKKAKRGEEQGPEQVVDHDAKTGGEKVARAAGTDLGKKSAPKKSAKKKAA